MIIRKARIGNTMHVIVGADEERDVAESEIKKLIDGLKANGDGIKLDETTIFIEDSPIVDTSQSGSGAYTWDATGNRVKHVRNRVTIKGSDRKEQFIRFIYKGLE